MFKALLVDKDDTGYHASVQQIEEARLPDAEVLVKVEYSSLNYKDALAITGQGAVVRHFPMVPGIDFAGTVLESTSSAWQGGESVFLNGWGLGEKHWGGLAQRARVNGDWLAPVSPYFTTRQTMEIGTAGYTAMLCILALERNGLKPGHGAVLVSGASGGVGSFAVSLLSDLGYRVVASTGKEEAHDYLHSLGAEEIIHRDSLSAPAKPLSKERWAAAIDTVGSFTLANICAALQYGGVVAACGLAQGMDFPASVAPFILRGITLAGVDSVVCPLEQRKLAWQRLGENLNRDKLAQITTLIPLEEVCATAQELLLGTRSGRVVVDLGG